MEEDAYAALALALGGGSAPAGDKLVFGEVQSWPSEENPARPHKVLAEGNLQEREDLLCGTALLPYGLDAGDRVLLLSVEEGQRYVILMEVVEV